MSKQPHDPIDPKIDEQPTPVADQAVQQQLLELTEALQRERADSLNIRRRHDEQIAGLKTTIKAQVVRDLLPVIDNFERAMKHLPTTTTPATVDPSVAKLQEWVTGVQKILAQFEKTLTTIGVTRIPTVGQPFDPRFHEAVSMDDADGGTTEQVIEELQSGYSLGDEVIRHAMVRVKLV